MSSEESGVSNLPHIKKPCRDCPYRKDALKGWLGADRVRELLAAESFVCHKKLDRQCAGHMLIKGEANAFVRMANRLQIPLELSGRELVFESQDQCIEHHRSYRDLPASQKLADT